MVEGLSYSTADVQGGGMILAEVPPAISSSIGSYGKVGAHVHVSAKFVKFRGTAA